MAYGEQFGSICLFLGPQTSLTSGTRNPPLQKLEQVSKHERPYKSKQKIKLHVHGRK